MDEEKQKQAAINDLSQVMNAKGLHNDVGDIAIAYFDNNIHNDDPFWHELEELIVDKIIEHKNQ